MTLTETLPILQAIADGEPWQYRRANMWFDTISSQDPVNLIKCGHEIRLTIIRPAPKPDKWAAEKAAFAEGKQIEIRQFYPRTAVWSQWALIKSPMFKGNDHTQYRIAPSPAYIPLGPEDVPPGSVFRRDCWPVGCYWTPTAITEEGPIFFNLRLPENPLWSSMAKESWQILRPNSTVWEECRKEAK